MADHQLHIFLYSRCLMALHYKSRLANNASKTAVMESNNAQSQSRSLMLVLFVLVLIHLIGTWDGFDHLHFTHFMYVIEQWVLSSNISSAALDCHASLVAHGFGKRFFGLWFTGKLSGTFSICLPCVTTNLFCLLPCTMHCFLNQKYCYWPSSLLVNEIAIWSEKRKKRL